LIQNTSENGNSIAIQVNNAGFYQNVCLDMEITSLSVSALLQLTKINEFDGKLHMFSSLEYIYSLYLIFFLGASAVNFSVAPQTTLEQMMSGDMGTGIFSSYYDEAALTLPALKYINAS
jgi:hypothetical protein